MLSGSAWDPYSVGVKGWEGCVWGVPLWNCWKQVQTACSFSRSLRYLFCRALSSFIYPNAILDLLLEQIYLSTQPSKEEVKSLGWNSFILLLFLPLLWLLSDLSKVSAWREKGTDQNTSDVDPHTSKWWGALLPPVAKPCWSDMCSFCGLSQLPFAKQSHHYSGVWDTLRVGACFIF